MWINSRVHPKKKGGREGVATWIRVRRKELCEDVRARMPLRFLVPKYRLPQKDVKVAFHPPSPPPSHFVRFVQELILRALNEGNEEELQLLAKALNSSSRTYERDHPSRFALCITLEERRLLMKDFRDDSLRKRDVERCTRREGSFQGKFPHFFFFFFLLTLD